MKPPKTASFSSSLQNWHALCDELLEITDPGVSHAKVTVDWPDS
ncbi:hypothetical protein [Parasphingorhabdus litoris]|nr:hypothetical protein [Parasphingorhabdus litoris]